MGAGVTNIPPNFCNGWTNLETVALSSNVASIGYNAFSGCSQLQSLDFLETVKSIDSAAFQNCRTLRDIALGPSITSLGGSAFYGCTSVTQLVANCSIDEWADGVFRSCNNLQTVVFGDAVTGLGQASDSGGLFSYCPNIKSLSVGAGVTSIPPNFCNGWTNLETVALSSNVASIGYNAFGGCRKLTKVLYSGNAPTAGSGIYSGTPEGLTSWVRQGTTGWDGTAGSMALPEKWQGRPIHRWGAEEYKELGETVPEERTEKGAVPLTWLDEYDLARDGDYEGAANGTAANGQPIWKCYLAGLDPTDPEAEFRVGLSMEDGKLKVTFSPDLNEDGTKAVRVYQVNGKRKAEEGEWEDLTDVTDYDAEGWRFFRVKVELPEAGVSEQAESTLP